MVGLFGSPQLRPCGIQFTYTPVAVGYAPPVTLVYLPLETLDVHVNIVDGE